VASFLLIQDVDLWFTFLQIFYHSLLSQLTNKNLFSYNDCDFHGFNSSISQLWEYLELLVMFYKQKIIRTVKEQLLAVDRKTYIGWISCNLFHSPSQQSLYRKKHVYYTIQLCTCGLINGGYQCVLTFHKGSRIWLETRIWNWIVKRFLLPS